MPGTPHVMVAPTIIIQPEATHETLPCQQITPQESSPWPSRANYDSSISPTTHLLWQAFCVTELAGYSTIDDHHPCNGFLQRRRLHKRCYGFARQNSGGRSHLKKINLNKNILPIPDNYQRISTEAV